MFNRIRVNIQMISLYTLIRHHTVVMLYTVIVYINRDRVYEIMRQDTLSI